MNLTFQNCSCLSHWTLNFYYIYLSIYLDQNIPKGKKPPNNTTPPKKTPQPQTEKLYNTLHLSMLS